jgi:fibronectin type 3 domain-containing protein
VLTAVARDAAGNQAESAPVTVTVNNPIVELAWDANTESDLAGYKIHVGTASGSYSTTIDVGNVTGFIVTALQPGTQYYFVVTAYNWGGLESGVSNEVAATR